jgi:hypothetical protein
MRSPKTISVHVFCRVGFMCTFVVRSKKDSIRPSALIIFFKNLTRQAKLTGAFDSIPLYSLEVEMKPTNAEKAAIEELRKHKIEQ